jgi:Protein of unknown function (DUF3039)
MSDTSTRPEVADPILEADRERLTHIVLEALRTEDGAVHGLNNSVVSGSIYGTPVRALCGKVWVPGRDPRRYPLCPTCKEIAEQRGWALPSA